MSVLPTSLRRRTAALFLPLALAAVLIAPWLAPYDPNAQPDIVGARLLPPTTTAYVVAVGESSWWIVTDIERSAQGLLARRGDETVTLAREAIVGQEIFLLGTDGLGRDLFSRLLFAARQTLVVGLAASAISVALGLLVGLLSVLGGRRIDTVLMRFTDVALSIPKLVLFLLCAAFVQPSTALVVIAIGLTTWPPMARLARGELLVLRQGDMLASARASGCSGWRTGMRHMLPQLAPLVAVTSMLRLSDAVVLEASLSFLGLGGAPGDPSLGGMIAAGQQALQAWWIALFPGLVLCAIVFVARAGTSRLAEAADPRSVA